MKSYLKQILLLLRITKIRINTTTKNYFHIRFDAAQIIDTY